MKIKNKKSKIITVCRECFKTFNEKKEFCNKCYSANLISNNEIEFSKLPDIPSSLEVEQTEVLIKVKPK